MEYFKKAHVPRNKSTRTGFKPQEKMKKQLKQMLHGYKQKDNEIIKKSTIMDDESEYSSSVSDFSDLNLTNSSQDGESILKTIDYTDRYRSSEIIGLSLNDASDDKSFVEEVNKMSLEESDSLSVCKNLEKSQTESSNSSNFSFESDLSIPTSSNELKTSSDMDSEEPEIFDADGNLACKILNKLQHKKCSKPIGTKTKAPLYINNVKQRETDEDISLPQHGPLRNQYICFEKTKILSDITNPNNVTEFKEMYYTNKFIESSLGDTSELSSPFVSMSASNVPSYCIDDVLGDYKHSVIRNLPSCSFDSFGLSYSEVQNESEIFEEAVSDNTTLSETETKPDEIIQLVVDYEKIPIQEFEVPLEIPVKVYDKTNFVVIVMHHPCEIYIHGKVKLQMLGGAVQICGYTAKDETCNIYAPQYNYAQCIKTTELDCIFNGLFAKLTSIGLTTSEAKEIVDTVNSNDAVYCLYPLRDNKMDFVESKMNADLFNKLNKNIDVVFKKSSEILNSSLYLSKPVKCFEENDTWKQAVNCGLKPKSRGIVCGGKGTGKSTFVKYYVNRLLAQGPVVVIDLDPGQCEFTVAGNLSVNLITEPLLGPNFTHLRTPELMLNIGMMNTMENPRRYAVAVQQIIAHCTEDPRLLSLPWIINTMGMCNTIGLKFICLAIMLSQPTFVVQINTKNPKKRFDCFLTEQAIGDLHIKYRNDPLIKDISYANLDYHLFVINSEDSPVKNGSLPPRDERYLNYLAYFGELLNTHRTTNFLEIIPYKVDIKSLTILTNIKVKEEDITKVLNGKIIALCHQVTHDMHGVFTLTDKPLLCLGHGLIRGIDGTNGMMYVSTPVSGERLSSVRCAVYADWVPELRGQEHYAGTFVPYRTAPAYQQRQLMFAPRRRFNPLLLLKMSRNPKLKA